MKQNIFLLLFVSFFLFVNQIPVLGKEIIVYPGDQLDKIRDKARDGDCILLHEGIYQFKETLVLGPQNSGITWKAFPGEKVVFSGGIPVTDWEPYKNGIWKTTLKRTEKLRQLYVNGIPATMAHTEIPIKGQGGYGEFIIQGNEPWAFKSGKTFDGVRFLKKDFPSIKDPSDLEIQSQSTWVTTRLCVRKMIEDDNCYALLLEQPFASFLQNQGWGTAFNVNSNLKIFNALEFLDNPGEFYFDRQTQTVYYMPRPNENMNIAEVTAPVVETLVSIKGKHLKEHVSNINFEGIIFENTAWQLIEVAGSHGGGGVQAAANTVKYGDINWHNSLYQVTDIASATIEITSADHISFTNNIFRELGSIGINMENDVNETTIEGNIFLHIGACAVNIGHPHHVYIGKQNGENEGYGPYHIDNQNDKWDETVEGLCTHIRISNNLIRRTGFENPSNVVISAIFGHYIDISHNDIRYAPYTGISLGWAWEVFDGTTGISLNKPTLSLRSNTIHHNRIGNVLQLLHDGGGIYLLAAQVPIEKDARKQTWTNVYGNYLYDFGGNTRAGIHPDNGSRFVHFYENVFDNIPWSLIKVSSYARKGDYRIDHNYANTALYWTELDLPYSPNTTITENVQVENNQWPRPAKNIIENSGLEPKYKYLLDTITTY